MTSTTSVPSSSTSPQGMYNCNLIMCSQNNVLFSVATSIGMTSKQAGIEVPQNLLYHKGIYVQVFNGCLRFTTNW